MSTPTLPDLTLAETSSGLRDRKKARRREDIVAAAGRLFARQGIDATTMADIAAACEISTPTVFNYFGSKDGVLIAIIEDGTRRARESERAVSRPDGQALDKVVSDLFARIATRTLAIADKRVWRYAEAAVIRNPDTELSRTYRTVGAALVVAITDVLAEYDLRLRQGGPARPAQIAAMLHDLWMPCFIRLITEDEMTLSAHDDDVRTRVLPLLALVLTDDSLAAPRRRITERG